MNNSAAASTATIGDALMNARRLLQSHPQSAGEQARLIIKADPKIAEAYFILAASLRLSGNTDEAAEVERDGLRVTAGDPVLNRADENIAAGRFGEAEDLLRRYLADTPNDPRALSLLARVALETERLREAEMLLRRAHGLAPSSSDARTDFEALLQRQAAAFAHDSEKPPLPPKGEEEFESAVRMNEEALKEHSDKPAVWLSYGHALRLSGRREESIRAYRRAIDARPTYGEAWWSLADLKTAAIEQADIATMMAQLESSDLSIADRTGLHFALGAALHDASQHEGAFRQFEMGNSLKRKTISYDVNATVEHVLHCKSAFSRQSFGERVGHSATDPIFIIGMPRSGSTLVEQILASHPLIEGTEELVYFGNLSSFVAEGRKAGLESSGFVDNVKALAAEQLEAIGGAYLWNAVRHRHSNRPRFIDKMPRNWLYLPLIKLALPNAKIIDVRRDAMDCCWSNYRQLFADSGEYSYSLNDLGSYYCAYVDMLSHFDEILPGAVHRLDYEKLINEPDASVRTLLEYLEVPFDQACLEFYNNPRAIKTASSEQVRRPINRAGIGQWKPYEAWLGPLKEALAPLHQGDENSDD